MAIETKTRTVQDVINTCTRQFGDEAGVQLRTSDVIRWVNDGQREICNRNVTINEKKATTNLTVNQSLYALKSDGAFTGISRIRSVRVSDIPLSPIPFETAEKYLKTTDGNISTGTPLYWYDDAGDVRLFPIPDATISGGLSVYFTTVPIPVTAAGDLLGIPDSYFNALIEYCMGQAYEMDENFQGAQHKQAQFDKSLGIMQNNTVVQSQTFPSIILDIEDM